jgi:hypothetical protein
MATAARGEQRVKTHRAVAGHRAETAAKNMGTKQHPAKVLIRWLRAGVNEPSPVEQGRTGTRKECGSVGAKKNPGHAWRCVIKEGCQSVHRRALGLLFMHSCHISITAGLVSLMGALLVARATAGPPAPSVRSPRPTNPFAGATATGAAWLVPPLSPGAQAEARRIGARLLRAYQAGSLRLARPDREPAQLRQLAAQGFLWSPEEQPIALTLPLLRTLNHLVARSTRQRPLGLLSLYRPLSRSRPREPHGRGEAIDVTAFGGYTIHARNPEACVNGVVALMKALPARAYRLGVPKAPHSDVFGLLPPPPRPRRPWPFFPPPLADTIDLPIVGG